MAAYAPAEVDYGPPDDEVDDDFTDDFEDDLEIEPVDIGEPHTGEIFDPLAAGRDTAFLDSNEALDTVRRALDENNDALRLLSEAVYELASNVRVLVDEIESLQSGMVAGGGGGGVTASARSP